MGRELDRRAFLKVSALGLTAGAAAPGAAMAGHWPPPDPNSPPGHHGTPGEQTDEGDLPQPTELPPRPEPTIRTDHDRGDAIITRFQSNLESNDFGCWGDTRTGLIYVTQRATDRIAVVRLALGPHVAGDCVLDEVRVHRQVADRRGAGRARHPEDLGRQRQPGPVIDARTKRILHRVTMLQEPGFTQLRVHDIHHHRPSNRTFVLLRGADHVVWFDADRPQDGPQEFINPVEPAAGLDHLDIAEDYVWWTEGRSNNIGRYDLRTGETVGYKAPPLPLGHFNPHGSTSSRAGARCGSRPAGVTASVRH